MVSGDESWIYAYDPDSKQQSTVWSGQQHFKKKVAKGGHVATIVLEDRKTVNADWYTTVCLPQVITEFRKNNSRRRVV